MCVLRTIFMFALAIQLSSVCIAQSTSAATDFQQIFEKENTSSIDTASQRPILLSIGTEYLPEWFYHIPVSSTSQLYAIGISDPKTNSKLATKQAYERALLQLSLMSGCSISGISDNYTDNSGNKYEEIYKYKGASSIPGKCTIVDSFNTRFGEKLLLITLNINPEDSISIKIRIDRYKSITKAEQGWFIYENLSVLSKRDSTTLAYRYSQNGNDFSSASIFNKQVIDIPLGMYEYSSVSKEQDGDTSKNTPSVKLPHKGLWFGYFQSLINNLSILASNQRSAIKTIDQLQQSSDTTLSRNTLNNFVYFYIKSITTLDGNLNIELNLRP